MAAIDNLEFLNLNTLRAYPIKEGLTRLSTDTVFTIPDDLIVDFTLAATSDVTKRFYISKIASQVSQVQIEVSDDADVFVGNFLIDVAAHTLYKDYALNASSVYTAANGRIVIGNLGNLSFLPTGTFLFTLATTEVETRTVIPSLKGLNRLIFENSDGSSFALAGDVLIEARSNMRFTYDSLNNKVLVDVGNGLGLNAVCDPTTQSIKTINGIEPDVDGNFTISFAACADLTVLPTNDGLLLNDICCKPCIGCEEIGVLTDRLVQLETDLIKFRDFTLELQTTFNTFKTTVDFTCSC